MYIIPLMSTLITICARLRVYDVHTIREICGCRSFFFIDAIRCTYKATFLFTALFRSMAHFRKSIKSRLVLPGTRSTDIPLWETGLNDSHVGSTAARRSCPTVPLLNIKRRRRKNSQSITRFMHPWSLLKADRIYRVFTDAFRFTVGFYMSRFPIFRNKKNLNYNINALGC